MSKKKTISLEKDAEALKNAMNTFGTDDDALIKIIANRKNEVRQKLKLVYKTMYGSDLIEDLKKETSGNFEDAIVALFETPTDFDCITLRNATKGLGTNEKTLIEIICSRSNEELRNIKARYKELYEKELEEVITSETSGDLQKILISILQCNRSENEQPNDALMEQKAKELYAAGEGKVGTDEPIFNKIFALYSGAELTQIARHYYKLYKRTIVQAIESEFSGDMENVYKTILCAFINPSEYFARRLNDSMKGLGTRDADLIRVCVVRDEIDMSRIKKYYKKLFNEELQEAIEGDTSGSYKKLLLEIINH